MKNLALLFPGQGSQYIGMGNELCKYFSIAKQVFEEANEELDFDLKKMCFEGDINVLTKTQNAQPAILTVSYAMFKVYMQEIGIRPIMCAGHSLGEFSALVSAGAMQFSDAIKIVRKRGELMQEAVSEGLGLMAAICGMDVTTIENECRVQSRGTEIVSVSNYNTKNQVVISGYKDSVLKAGDELEKQGARIIPLKVSAPFHCNLMKPSALKLRAELEKYTFYDMEWPVISNVTGLPYNGKEEIISNLEKQVVSAVQWQKSVQYMLSKGITSAIEIGPKSTLKNFLKEDGPGIAVFSYDDKEDVGRLNCIRQFSVSSQNKIANDDVEVAKKCLVAAVSTRNSNWDDREYAKGVIEPYKRMQQIISSVEKESGILYDTHIIESLKLLQKIFITKKVSEKEQDEWFERIIGNCANREIYLKALS